jgi:hydroxymethylpyrimidine/phosphomethylpyrimidine kinase
MTQHYLRVLSIAGFDGSGGAGIQADLKTFSALGCYGMTVLTALPVQNTVGVKSIYDIPTPCVEEQLQAILDDIGIDALKFGMLHRTDIIEAVAAILHKGHHFHKILDPVMVAKSGDRLLTPDAVNAMREKIFPMTTVLTPNLPEASVFLEREIKTKSQMERAALDLALMGPQAVVIKGGHLSGDSCDDCLCINGANPQIHWLPHHKINTRNTHGSGCTFSAALTANLAKNMTILDAVKQAKRYISKSLEAGSHYTLGHGHGPVHHFHDLWPVKTQKNEKSRHK